MNYELNRKNSKKRNHPEERQSLALGKFFIGLAVVILVSLIIYTPEQKTVRSGEWKIGGLVANDIVMRQDLTIEDFETTEQNRKRAAANLIPIYEYNDQKIQDAAILISDWITYLKDQRAGFRQGKTTPEHVQADIEKKFSLELSAEETVRLIKANLFGRIDLNRLLSMLRGWLEKGILISKIGIKKGPTGMIVLASEKGGSQTVRPDGLYDLSDVSEELRRLLKESSLAVPDQELVASILVELIGVNVTYSRLLNSEQEKKAMDGVNPFTINLRKGKTILHRGDMISAENAKLLELINQAEKSKEKGIADFYLIIILLALLFLFLWKFYRISKIGGINRQRLNIVTSLTLIVSALIYRISIFLLPLIMRNVAPSLEARSDLIFYAIPFATGALTIAFLFNLPSLVIFSFANAIISGIICQWNFRIMLFVLMGNITVGFAIEYYQRLKRSSILKAGFYWLVPLNALSVLLFHVTAPGGGGRDWLGISVAIALAVFSALLAAFIANFLIPLWEVIFKLITDLKLIEITNLNLPVFREMLEKAPGTYHHSQMVASLAESVAPDLGLSALQLRAMALYHDIGKIDSPQFFTENYSVYENPHQGMTARESAKLIIAHISNGMDRVEKLKLPQRISDAIITHHGTKLVKYFYEQAKKESDTAIEELDSNVFRYSGRKPQEIEDAVIMLADQMEAASKSLSSPSDEELKNVIEQIISANVAENQFDECSGLTFKALKYIADSFYEKLSSIYHQRIAYPGFDFKEKKDHADHQPQ